MANSPPWPTWSQMAAPARCTASTIGARRSTRSLVWTRVMPGLVRPSAEKHELPCTMSPTPASALGTNALA